jgi:hypothetical protein
MIKKRRADMTVEGKILDMIENKVDCDFDTLMTMYEQLEPVSNQFMIGQWHGGVFDSKRDIGPFYGKRFNSENDVEPMLFKNEEGTIYTWKDLGAAQLREVKYGGKVQATVIYDDRPLMDYFRKVSDDAVLGLGEYKNLERSFFWLIRDK